MLDVVDSNNPAALYEEARRLVDRGRDAEASQKLDAALALRPDFAQAFSLGGYILERGGRPDVALRFYQRAVGLQRDLAVAWFNMAKLLTREARFAEALAALDAGLAVAPHDADALNTRSAALRALWRLDESVAAARAALKQRPNFPEAAVNLGTALLKSAQPGAALEAYARAAKLRRGYADAICGQALALRALDRLGEARAAFDRAVALGCREAVSGRGCLDLMQGDFERGWEGYEARWIEGKSIAQALGVRYPLWRGPQAPPARVLVINDHGLGDTIQFARYLPLMARAGAEPHFLCPAKLHRLIGPAVGGRIFEREPAEVKFDAQIAISSLPRAFATRLDSVPDATPYLFAEPERVARWAQRIGPQGFRIGCVWQGNANPEADIARSFALRELAPLAAVAGVRLISLQRGFGEEQLWQAPPAFAVERLAADFDAGAQAFLDAAAVMASLDVVVTCDTSIAHLAGALGRPVWVALKRDSEWRWLRGRDDSPWYPTMRLFRQRVEGEWGPVFAAMAQALTVLRISA
ncbi:MAG: glycosyltransferase family protein [Pseudomonadota bacterium]|nr:glycosyltransferase family protein [Pseudomonadota bacterium]